MLDLSANLDGNWMIFYSIASFWSSLSKSTRIPNFSPLFIVRFDQISKIPTKIPLFIYVFDPYSPLYSLICDYIFKLVSLELFLTRVSVYSMIVRKHLKNYHGFFHDLILYSKPLTSFTYALCGFIPYFSTILSVELRNSISWNWYKKWHKTRENWGHQLATEIDLEDYTHKVYGCWFINFNIILMLDTWTTLKTTMNLLSIDFNLYWIIGSQCDFKYEYLIQCGFFYLMFWW